MEWTYQTKVTINHPVTVNVPLLGTQTRIRLNINPQATIPGVVDAGIKFNCKTPVFIEGCYGLMHDLRRVGPKVTTQLDKTPYASAQILGGVAGAVGFPITIKQPVLLLTSQMNVSATNAGKCYNIQIESKIDYTPGSITIDPPDITIPAPPMPTPVNIPVGPFTFDIGKKSVSVIRSQYQICCCCWPDFPEWNLEDGEPDSRAFESIFQNIDRKCKCDFAVKHLKTEFPSRSPAVVWKAEALEGPCSYKAVRVLIDRDGTRFRKKKQPDKIKKTRP